MSPRARTVVVWRRSLYRLRLLAYSREAMSWLVIFWLAAMGLTTAPGTAVPATNVVNWSTNGPAVFNTVRLPATNSAPGETIATRDEVLFDHYLPGTLNNLIWTNFIAHTNGRTVAVWTERSHPANWPTNGPMVAWATNGLMWGMRGLTALSPCWEGEGNSGQVPVTALTRRHGYTRGHSMGLDGFRATFAGKKVWFVTTNNELVVATVRREVVRVAQTSRRDYTILFFSQALPPSIEPMRVVAVQDVMQKYPLYGNSPRPLFLTEQTGHVSAGVPGFMVSTWKGGDSGSPDMLPMPGELVFYQGRSTSCPNREMQTDMNILCVLEGLDQEKYQMQWVDLSRYPSYPMNFHW